MFMIYKKGVQADALKRRMKYLEDINEPAKALEVLSELINMGCRDAEVMFSGAKNYFQLGDFERSVKWINLTLDFDPGHIGARLLLARHFILNNRVPEALNLYDYIVEKYRDKLTQDDRDEMEDILMYYAEQNKYLVAFYPNVVTFLVEEYNMKQLLSVVDWHKGSAT